MRSSLLLLVLLVVAVVPYLIAVSNCINPPTTGAATAWAAGSIITVVASKFPQQLQSCVQTAFDNWNTANQSNGSGVRYNVTFSNTPLDPNAPNGYQVTYQPVTKTNSDGFPFPGETGGKNNNTTRATAFTNIDPHITDCAALTETMAHEIGHTEGLGDCTACGSTPGTSVMIGKPCVLDSTGTQCASPQVPDYNNNTQGVPAPTTCDNATINSKVYPPSGGGGGGGGISSGDPCLNSATATPSASGAFFIAPLCSPIIIDTEGQGFHLTSAAAGVVFDISGSGRPVQIAWTDSGFRNAFLALPATDGLVHNGKELFGNFTPQPQSAHPNGFLALAEFDKPENGGNGNGIIDDDDAVFSRLRLWIDENHDGVCQVNELHTLPELGVFSLALKYRESRRTDDFGNQFRYKANINPSGGRRDERDERSEVGRWTYDVFLTATKK